MGGSVETLKVAVGYKQPDETYRWEIEEFVDNFTLVECTCIVNSKLKFINKASDTAAAYIYWVNAKHVGRLYWAIHDWRSNKHYLINPTAQPV